MHPFADFPARILVCRSSSDISGEIYLVGYIATATGEARSILESIFRTDLNWVGGLPLEAGPFSLQDAEELQDKLVDAQGSVGRWTDDGLIWQPEPSALRSLAIDEATWLVFEQERTTTRGGGSDWATQVQAYSLPRSWAFILYSGPYIPPGVGYVVDRYSRRILERPYIDVCKPLEDLGFTTPRASHEQLKALEEQMRKSHDRVELPFGTPVVCEYCGCTAAAGSTCCGHPTTQWEWVRRDP